MSEPLLELADVAVAFARRGAAPVRAVDGVSLELARGEVLALVGESGSGKSTLARACVRLVAPCAGTIRLRPRNSPHALDVGRARDHDLRLLRRTVQLVFQDPLASLNPRLTVGAALAEPLALVAGRGDVEARTAELLEAVGLSRALAHSRPHQLSGGQAQRAAIARALALEPELLVCDEVLSALDVSVQAQVLELLARLRRERGLSLLFIAHDLATAGWLADRIAVMQRGRIVEQGDAQRVLREPREPYTRALVAASAMA